MLIGWIVIKKVPSKVIQIRFSESLEETTQVPLFISELATFRARSPLDFVGPYHQSCAVRDADIH